MWLLSTRLSRPGALPYPANMHTSHLGAAFAFWIFQILPTLLTQDTGTKPVPAAPYPYRAATRTSPMPRAPRCAFWTWRIRQSGDCESDSRLVELRDRLGPLSLLEPILDAEFGREHLQYIRSGKPRRLRPNLIRLLLWCGCFRQLCLFSQ